MSTELGKSLLGEYAPRSCSGSAPNKVSIIGCGQVGIACAVSILMQKIASNVSIVDVNKDLLEGEILDLQHGSCFLKDVRISGSSDYTVISGSKVCIITAGARQEEGETRLDLVQRNVEIMKKIVPQIVKNARDAIIIVVSNPCDILTYLVWKLSGLPVHKVFGSGTNLDSGRFRVMLSQKLNVAPQSVHAWIIGEHGDSSVPIWSAANVAGVRLRAINPDVAKEGDPDEFDKIHNDVIQAAYKIISFKGCTNWAIGLSVAQLTNSVLSNSNNVHPISVNANGYFGIDYDVFLSIPSVLNSNGVQSIVSLKLECEETVQLKKSASALKEIIDGIQM